MLCFVEKKSQEIFLTVLVLEAYDKKLLIIVASTFLFSCVALFTSFCGMIYFLL